MTYTSIALLVISIIFVIYIFSQSSRGCNNNLPWINEPHDAIWNIRQHLGQIFNIISTSGFCDRKSREQIAANLVKLLESDCPNLLTKKQYAAQILSTFDTVVPQSKNTHVQQLRASFASSIDAIIANLCFLSKNDTKKLSRVITEVISNICDNDYTKQTYSGFTGYFLDKVLRPLSP